MNAPVLDCCRKDDEVPTPVRLQTHVFNPLGSKRALLIHGLTSDGATWWRLASELADAGWMVVAPDLRGHGRSPAASAYDLDSFVADVALIGDGWDLVVGHSLGGAVAAKLLTQLDITSAVLIDPVLKVTGGDNATLSRAHLLASTGVLDPDEVRAQHPNWHERDVQRKVTAAALVTPDVVDAVLDENVPWDISADVANSGARVHLVAADPVHGGTLQPEVADALADGVRVTAEIVTGCGHSIQRERPEIIAAAVANVAPSDAAD